MERPTDPSMQAELNSGRASKDNIIGLCRLDYTILHVDLNAKYEIGIRIVPMQVKMCVCCRSKC